MLYVVQIVFRLFLIIHYKLIEIFGVLLLFVEYKDVYGAACTGLVSLLKAVLFLCGLGTVYSYSAVHFLNYEVG